MQRSLGLKYELSSEPLRIFAKYLFYKSRTLPCDRSGRIWKGLLRHIQLPLVSSSRSTSERRGNKRQGFQDEILFHLTRPGLRSHMRRVAGYSYRRTVDYGPVIQSQLAFMQLT